MQVSSEHLCFVKTLWKVSRLFHPFVGPTSIQDTQFSISDKMPEGLKIRFCSSKEKLPVWLKNRTPNKRV